MATILLDTHALLWWLDGDERLSPAARRAIGEAATVVMVSAATAWEIITKHRLGKLLGAAPPARLLQEARSANFVIQMNHLAKPRRR